VWIRTWQRSCGSLPVTQQPPVRAHSFVCFEHGISWQPVADRNQNRPHDGHELFSAGRWRCHSFSRCCQSSLLARHLIRRPRLPISRRSNDTGDRTVTVEDPPDNAQSCSPAMGNDARGVRRRARRGNLLGSSPSRRRPTSQAQGRPPPGISARSKLAAASWAAGDVRSFKIGGVKRAIDVGPFGELADPRVAARLAARAEEQGWDGFFVWDHIDYRAPVRPWPTRG